MTSPAPSFSTRKGRGRGRNFDQSSSSPSGLSSDRREPTSGKYDEQKSKASTTASRGRSKRPEIQLYVPRGRRQHHIVPNTSVKQSAETVTNSNRSSSPSSDQGNLDQTHSDKQKSEISENQTTGSNKHHKEIEPRDRCQQKSEQSELNDNDSVNTRKDSETLLCTSNLQKFGSRFIENSDNNLKHASKKLKTEVQSESNFIDDCEVSSIVSSTEVKTTPYHKDTSITDNSLISYKSTIESTSLECPTSVTNTDKTVTHCVDMFGTYGGQLIDNDSQLDDDRPELYHIDSINPSESSYIKQCDSYQIIQPKANSSQQSHMLDINPSKSSHFNNTYNWQQCTHDKSIQSCHIDNKDDNIQQAVLYDMKSIDKLESTQNMDPSETCVSDNTKKSESLFSIKPSEYFHQCSNIEQTQLIISSETGILGQSESSEIGILEQSESSEIGILGQSKSSEISVLEHSESSEIGILGQYKSSDVGILEQSESSETGILEQSESSETGILGQSVSFTKENNDQIEHFHQSDQTPTKLQSLNDAELVCRTANIPNVDETVAAVILDNSAQSLPLSDNITEDGLDTGFGGDSKNETEIILDTNDIPAKCDEAVNLVNEQDDDDDESWDKMFDDNGDCLEPSLIDELTAHVGEVQIDKPKIDYLAYQPKDPDLSSNAYNHLIEIYDFPSDFITRDLLMSFQAYMAKGFDIKWVDDTHAIGIFASTIAAQDAVQMIHPLFKVRPIDMASKQSKLKAKRTAEFLQPYKERPKTTAIAARRLVSGALGLNSKISKEKRDEEKIQLREAKEKRKNERKLKQDIWDGSVGKCVMDDS